MFEVSFPSVRTPGNPIVLGQITVFLGANGTGKSRLMQEVTGQAATLFPNHTLIRIEGGRAISIKDSLALNNNTYNNYRTLDIATQTYKNKIGGTISSRVHDALLVLERTGRELKTQHSDEVADWQENGASSPCPVRSQPPLERVFDLFNEVFPRIELSYDEPSQVMSCKKGTATYRPSQMSDGEKQCFSIIADLVELADDLSVIFVDEPELNLNPLLANRLWNTIESEFPDAKFVYASHSVSFAMRDSVNRVHVLSDNNESIQEIAVISDLTIEELPPLLGSIPAIFTSSSAVVTEGTDRSFDGIFYKWLMPEQDFETVPVGGGKDVEAVAARRGVWESISANFRVVGVVDRDYKSEEELATLQSFCTVLKWHEAESYLCNPNLLAQLASKIGTADQIPSESQIETIIREYFQKNILQICAKRVFARLTHRIGVSARRRVLAGLSDYESLNETIASEVSTELEKTSKVFESEAVSSVIAEERGRCEAAISGEEINSVLTLAPGKELLSKLAPMIGCKNSLAVARAAKTHLEVGTFPELVEIRDVLRSRIQ